MRPAQAFGGPSQGVAVTDLADAIAAALQHKRGAHFLHQIGAIVRGRAVDPQPHGDTGFFQRADRASAGGQDLIAARAMRDCRSGADEPLELIGVEMHAMR